MQKNIILMINSVFFYYIVGNIGVKWAILMNVPYVFMPLWVAFKLFKNRPSDSKQVCQVKRLLYLYYVILNRIKQLEGYISCTYRVLDVSRRLNALLIVIKD